MLIYTYIDMLIYISICTHTHTHITTGMVTSHDMGVCGHSPPTTFLTGNFSSKAIN